MTEAATTISRHRLRAIATTALIIGLSAAPVVFVLVFDPFGWLPAKLTSSEDQLFGMSPRHRAAVFAILIGIVVAAATASYAGFLRDSIAKYRLFEEILIDLGIMELDDLLEYHRQYSWNTLGALTFSAIFVGISIIATSQPFANDAEALWIIGLSTALLMLAVVAFLATDLSHLNALSPLVPIRARFKLINLSVLVGGLGSVLTSLACVIFVALIDPMLTYIGAIAFAVLQIWILILRRIPEAELKQYFRIDDDTWKTVIERTRAAETQPPKAAVTAGGDAVPGVAGDRSMAPYRHVRDRQLAEVERIVTQRLLSDTRGHPEELGSERIDSLLQTLAANLRLQESETRILRDRFRIHAAVTEALRATVTAPSKVRPPAAEPAE